MAVADDWISEAWSSHHGILLDIAYRLLGSYSEAEDIVQEAFSRLLRTDLDPIEDLRAWLVVVVSRLCLDHLRSARVRREAYIGPWFPEPLIQSDDRTADPSIAVTMDESVRMALLIVLERMSPAERVVFVLHDVFEFPFSRVADMVGRSPAACRQLAGRARRRIREEAGAPRFAPDPGEQRRVVEAFITACASGEIEALLPLLDPEVMGWADVGVMLPIVSRPRTGRDEVAGSLMSFLSPATGTELRAHMINGEPGVVAFRQGAVFAAFALTARGGAITRIYGVVDPRKLGQARRVLERPEDPRP